MAEEVATIGDRTGMFGSRSPQKLRPASTRVVVVVVVESNVRGALAYSIEDCREICSLANRRLMDAVS
jgi:hypothetical protein